MKFLTIRDAQMAALTDAFDLRWLRGEFEALYPVACATMGPEGVARFVEACRARARKHGIGRQHHLLYLALEMIFGETFTQEAWAQDALAGDSATAMDRLREAAVFRLAAVAEHEQRQEEADRQ